MREGLWLRAQRQGARPNSVARPGQIGVQRSARPVEGVSKLLRATTCRTPERRKIIVGKIIEAAPVKPPARHAT
jgi:hypothetical protein